MRTLDNEVLAKIQHYILTFSRNFAKTSGTQIDISFPTSCPATINDDKLVEQFTEFAKGQKISIEKPEKPSLGADDFAQYAIRKPGLYLQIGAGGKGALHTEDLELDEEFLIPAIAMVGSFIRFLSEQK